MKRVWIVALLALSLIAAAPADRTEFVFDPRIPLDNRQLLERELAAAMQDNGLHGTVTISLRVIEPQSERVPLVASAR